MNQPELFTSLLGQEVAEPVALSILPDPPKDESCALSQPAVPNVRALVAQVVEAEQDFEFYPTTGKIIRELCEDISSFAIVSEYSGHTLTSLLDVGAGNGKVLMAGRKRKRISKAISS